MMLNGILRIFVIVKGGQVKDTKLILLEFHTIYIYIHPSESQILIILRLQLVGE